MSKIKVNEIESSSTNVKLAAKGSGVVKVKGAGGSDGTLQLNSGTHSVKIKSPAHSAQQSYTMILPDNNIETGKFLKVKSVTGSGNTATGQLEYATISEPDRANLNASAVTSGTLPADRFSPMPDTVSAFSLVSVSTVGATDVAEIEVTGFEKDKKYLLIAKRLVGASPSQWYFHARPYYDIPDFGAGQATFYGVEQHAPSSGNGNSASRPYGDLQLKPSDNAPVWQQTMGCVMEILNDSTHGATFSRCMWCGNSNLSSGPYNYQDAYVGHYYPQPMWISSIKFLPYQSYQNFTQGTTILLYKYN